jgi:hypothetical protein
VREFLLYLRIFIARSREQRTMETDTFMGYISEEWVLDISAVFSTAFELRGADLPFFYVRKEKNLNFGGNFVC